MTLIRYKDLVSKLYCELKEEVVTDSFLVLTTGPAFKGAPRKIKNQIKEMEEPARYCDMRDIFKAGQQEKGNNTDNKTVIEID